MNPFGAYCIFADVGPISNSQRDVAKQDHELNTLKCQMCSDLKSTHRDRIKTCVRLMEELNRSSSQQSRTELQEAISNSQTELYEAWKRLGSHRRLHAFGSEIGNAQKCKYCGADTPPLSNDGRPICDHCVADLEFGRKPPQRESV